MMDCSAARDALWPPERPRLAEEAVLDAQRHIETCDACRAYLRQDRRLLDAYAALRRREPPPALRQRVLDSLRRASGSTPVRSPVSRHAPSIGAAALAVLIIAVLLWRSGPGPASVGATDDATVFVEDYIRRAVGEDRIATADPAEISRFLMRELGIRVPPLRAVGLAPTGAEICLLEGRRGALIRYDRNGRTLSYYVIPREGTVPRGPAIAPRAGMATPNGEPAVVTWATEAVEHALVAAAPPEDLLEIARSALPSPR